MPLEVWSTVGAWALIDAFNPPVLIILIFVLGRPNAFENGMAYSAGMLGTHLAGGFIFAGTFAQFSDLLVAWFNDIKQYAGIVEAVLGFAALIMSVIMTANPFGHRPSSGSGLFGWAFIGFSVTMTKLVFAPIYVSQVGVIVLNTEGSSFWFLMGLLYYHLVAFFPFFALWLIWLIWRDDSRKILGDLNDAIREYTPMAMKYGLMALGFVLLADGIARNYGAPLLG